MSLPTIEPIPDENASLPPARRRRQRRLIMPLDSSEQADFLHELSIRTVPSFDYFLFSLLSGLVLAAALLLDAPALFVLSVLLAPYMAPLMGISLGTITGSVRFVLQSLVGLIVGSLIVFLCGLLAGWAANMLPAYTYQQAANHTVFTLPDFFVLVLGAGLTAYLVIQAPNQRPLAASVAVAYGLYLPVGTAGFGMVSGVDALWPEGLTLFTVHLIWAVLTGTVVLAARGLRPLNTTGYLLTGLYGLAGLAALALMFLSGAVLAPWQPAVAGAQTAGVDAGQSTPAPAAGASVPTPSATVSFTPTVPPSTATPTPTRTLVPTRTATETITPVPTPIWARISASEGDGALIRSEPNYNATVVQSLLNGTLVEVLPDVTDNSGVAWVHVRAVNGKEGWIVRSLLRTATPAPNW